METEKPERSLIHTIGKAGALEALAGLNEVAIDALTDPGVLREIPVVGTLFALGRAGIAARDFVLVQKLRAFLEELRSVPLDEREKFARRMESDVAELDRIGMQLMVQLDRFEDLEKARMLGRAFAHYLRGALSRKDFNMIARTIDRCMADDLCQIGQGSAIMRASNEPYLASDLQSCGLIELAEFPALHARPGQPTYRWTDLGRRFYKVALTPAGA